MLTGVFVCVMYFFLVRWTEGLHCTNGSHYAPFWLPCLSQWLHLWWQCGIRVRHTHTHTYEVVMDEVTSTSSWTILQSCCKGASLQRSCITIIVPHYFFTHLVHIYLRHSGGQVGLKKKNQGLKCLPKWPYAVSFTILTLTAIIDRWPNVHFSFFPHPVWFHTSW